MVEQYKPKSDLLVGRTILITGAGDGIGKVAAQTFAKYGADVLLLGKTRSKLEAVNDSIVKIAKTRPVIIPVDLEYLQESSLISLRDSINTEFGKLDGLLHNAAKLGPKVPIEHYPETEFESVMRINLFAVYQLSRILLPLLSKANDASVVLTSSGVGRKGRAYWGAYAVSKFAVEGLAEVLADELQGTTNIRINTVNPGGIRTSMRAEAYPAENALLLPTPATLMPLYLYLMGPDSVGITGRRFEALSWKASIKS